MTVDDPGNDERWVNAVQGDHSALAELLELQRESLSRMVDLRMDRHLRARLDASDVIQETQVEVTRRFSGYLERQPMPFALWVRKTAMECLLRLRRQHVETQMRSAECEVRLPDQSSIILARHLLSQSTASQHMSRQETIDRVQLAVAALPEQDREIVLMRNYENLSNADVSRLLEIPETTARRRYASALLTLKQKLTDAE